MSVKVEKPVVSAVHLQFKGMNIAFQNAATSIISFTNLNDIEKMELGACVQHF